MLATQVLYRIVKQAADQSFQQQLQRKQGPVGPSQYNDPKHALPVNKTPAAPKLQPIQKGNPAPFMNPDYIAGFGPFTTPAPKPADAAAIR